MPATYLLKTEPSEYAFDDLVRDRRTVWSGVTNAAALIHARAVRSGDHALIYHTGDERAIVGLATITSDPYEDPEKPGRNAAGLPKFAVFDIAPVKPARRPLTLDAIKSDARFNVPGFDLVRLPRLSIMPVPGTTATLIRKLAGL